MEDRREQDEFTGPTSPEVQLWEKYADVLDPNFPFGRGKRIYYSSPVVDYSDQNALFIRL